MRRPADCIDDAADFRAEAVNADGGLIALSDQLEAKALGLGLLGGEQERYSGIRALAFLIALSDAIFDQLEEERGTLCPHMVDPSAAEIIDCHFGFVACRTCSVQLRQLMGPWNEEGLCDVCGAKAPPPGVTIPMVFGPLGSAVAFADVCGECRDFLRGDE
jgi:hypothetical protein